LVDFDSCCFKVSPVTRDEAVNDQCSRVSKRRLSDEPIPVPADGSCKHGRRFHCAACAEER
jgi:hypothetical protein